MIEFPWQTELWAPQTDLGESTAWSQAAWSAWTTEHSCAGRGCYCAPPMQHFSSSSAMLEASIGLTCLTAAAAATARAS